MHSTESRFVTGLETVLFACLYVCTFQPGGFMGWGIEGVKWTELWGKPLFLPYIIHGNDTYLLLFFVLFCICPTQKRGQNSFKAGLLFLVMRWDSSMQNRFP